MHPTMKIEARTMQSAVINPRHLLRVLAWGLALLGMSAYNVTGPEVRTQLPILNRFDGSLGADHLAWSPDSEHLAFMQGNQRLELAQLVVLDISTGISKTVGSHQWNYNSPDEWSPDGTQIVVAKNGELWLIRVADGSAVYLTRGEGAAWSPNEQTLAVFRSPLSGGPPDYFQISFVTPEGKEIDTISAGMIPPPEPTPTPHPFDPNDS
jgi:Tol biopolymer transport system component